MKCPTCSFICADEKDVCPKCLLDLRKHKRKLGLQISHPKVQYKKLLALERGDRAPSSFRKTSESPSPRESVDTNALFRLLAAVFLPDDEGDDAESSERPSGRVEGKQVRLPPEELRLLADEFDREMDAVRHGKRDGVIFLDKEAIVESGPEEEPSPSSPSSSEPGDSKSVEEFLTRESVAFVLNGEPPTTRSGETAIVESSVDFPPPVDAPPAAAIVVGLAPVEVNEPSLEELKALLRGEKPSVDDAPVEEWSANEPSLAMLAWEGRQTRECMEPEERVDVSAAAPLSRLQGRNEEGPTARAAAASLHRAEIPLRSKGSEGPPPHAAPSRPSAFNPSFAIRPVEVEFDLDRSVPATEGPDDEEKTPVYFLDLSREQGPGLMLKPTPTVDVSLFVRSAAPLEAGRRTPGIASPMEVTAYIDSLFENAERSLGQESELGFEFTLEHLAMKERSEELELLFDLASDSLVDPERLKKYVQELLGSDERRVEAPELSKAVAKVEDALDAPGFGLRARQKSATEAEEAETRKARLPPPPLPVRGAAASFLVDSAFAAALTFSTIVGTHSGANPLFLDALAGLEPLRLEDLVFVGLSFVALFPAALFVYQAAMGLIARTTFGLHYANLVVLDERGVQASRSRLLVRSAVEPLALALGGSLPTLFGRRSLADWIAGTRLARWSEDRG